MDTPFPMSVRTMRGHVILTPETHEITFKNNRDFLRAAKTVITEKCPDSKRYVLDFKNIEIIDSVSLGTLVAILKYVSAQQAALIIVNVADPIKELFELLHFDTVFSIYDTLVEALKIEKK